jgi:hypothetical protein
MKRIKALTSKSGEKMVIAYNDNLEYSVFTAEEYSQGEGYRYAEFDGITNIDEAVSQARNY